MLIKGKKYKLPGGRIIKVLTVSPWGNRAFVQPLPHNITYTDGCGATITNKDSVSPFSISIQSLLEEV